VYGGGGGVDNNAQGIVVGKPDGKRPLKDLVVDGKKILKPISKC